MMSLYQELAQDVRFSEGLKSCMNCGVCTAICPAAEFYDYDPRVIINIVQSKDDSRIEELLKSDVIWYCGQCMSCKTRCPRGNCPGLIISVLRKISQEKGFFTSSEKGRQQYVVLKTVGANILKHGYCVHPSEIKPELHPEQGPLWELMHTHRKEMYERLGANLDKDGAGTLRKIPKESLDELHFIIDESGGTRFFKTIEKFSKEKASAMGYSTDEQGMNEYQKHLNEGTNG